MKKLLIIITVLLSTLLLSAQEQQVVPYTLADRDRLSSVEAEIKVLSTKISSFENQMNTKFDAVNERIDSLFWMMGITAAFMIFLLGYTIWDRRTALKPALDKASSA